MISKDQVKHIAKLARLGTTEKEEEKFQKDISSILDYFEILKEVDTSGIKATFHSSEEFIDSRAIMREDESAEASEETTERLISLAPDKKERQIKVKAIL